MSSATVYNWQKRYRGNGILAFNKW
ncbi:MAG: hypothetical protein LBD61_04870 [Endomicrobium sp.]|nr:hypothetical protein [Endomicrobium sp.]